MTTTDEQITTAAASVQLDALVKAFPSDKDGVENLAVNEVSLTVESGEFVTLLGPSGCGKTTTMRIVAGFETPTAGRVFVGGRDITETPANKRHVGMVFQNYALFPHMDVTANVAYGLRVQGIGKAEAGRRVRDVLRLMELDGLGDRAPGNLSGGQQQRVALARAIVTEPRVLLFDEPLSNLDAKLRVHLRDELRRIQQRLGITSIYVTHDQGEAMAMSDRIAIMKDGRLEQCASPIDTYLKPATAFVADFMGRADFFTVAVRGVAGSRASVELLGVPVEADVGSEEQTAGGQQACLVVRPEFWSVGDGPFRGRVERATFFGTYIEYEVSAGDATFTVEDYQHGSLAMLAPGEEISLALKSHGARLVHDDR